MNEKKLLELGFIKIDDPVIYYRYELNVPYPDHFETKPALCLTRERNIWEFALFIESIIIFTKIQNEDDIIDFIRNIESFETIY